MALAGCGVGDNSRQKKPTPLPGNVPLKPEYGTADDVVRKLDSAGIPCVVTRRPDSDKSGGTSLGCASTIDGLKFENEIHVLNPDVFTRDDLGVTVTSRTEPPYGHTLVVAGHWFVRVTEPRFAPKIADALGGVVIKPKGPKIPKFKLPRIPDTPRYDTVDALADDLDRAVGCADREGGGGNMSCTTGKSIGASPNCATLNLYTTHADRDAALREAIAYKGVPATLVTAGNWTVNLCDYDLGSRVADALGGTVVSYDGG
ncbi:hypothetical protein CD790_13550 [Streptomyces sp. SAJ15]|nr:hypothetical protein CD790_13550 [Streptomyces sp. SAJ15]